jgi:TetR/AcrR family transcriptional regulator, transcriptional repressor for nem operon
MTKLQHDSRTRLLDATLKVVRATGYTATRIEDACAEAGLTKGSFSMTSKARKEKGEVKVAPRLKQERRRMLESSI